MHQHISTWTSVVNTTVLVVAAVVAYVEFVAKSDTSEAMRVENAYNSVREVYAEGGFMMEYYFEEDLGDFEYRVFEDDKFADRMDKALAYYTSVGMCVAINKCDPEIIKEYLCSYIMTDALVINRTAIAQIENKGMFIDRLRFWKFYEQVEKCLSFRLEQSDMDHAAFLGRFGDEIDMLKRVDRAMFKRLKERRSD